MRLMPTDVSSRRGATPIAVEPQMLDWLVHLVQNRDRIVRKDDRLAPVRDGRVVATLASRINAAQAMP
jgi:DNA-binding winged helix-turn-helix (wHTH) protein